MRWRPFPKSIAQKIYLGVVLPLAVLLVAGVLVPIFVWISLDRHSQEFDQRSQRLQRAERLQRAGADARAAAALLNRGDDPRQPGLLRARETFRDTGLELALSLEDAPAALRQRLQRAEQGFRVWFRQVQQGNRRADFEPVRRRLDELIAATEKARNDYRPTLQRAEVLRRTIATIVPLLAAILSLVLGRNIARSITRPLEDLTRAVQILGEGGDPEVLDDKLPDDELGNLQRSFTDMARVIRERESDLIATNNDLASSRRRVEAVLNATNDGIALLSRTGQVALVNERFAFFFGLEQDQLLAQSVERVLPHLLSRFTNRDRVHERLRDPDLTSEDSFDLIHPSIRTVRLFTAPVREGEDDELLGRIVVLRDITRETQVDRMKSEFVSTVSHELRTPLTAIQGYVDLILEGKPGPLTETQHEFLAIMQVSTQRLTALISDLLDVSRIEAGKIELREDDVAYPPLVELVVRMLQGEAKARDVTLSVQIAPEKYTPVRGDVERLQQVLTNLISNGIKYTPPGGSITVTVRPQESFIATCVADTGIGIPLEDRNKVFEKFYRADNSTTRQAGGTGLGLSISRAIVEQLGGSIWVESEPGKGSKFWFTLPLAPPNEEDEEPLPLTNELPASAPGQLYLVVASDTGALHRISHALRPQGIIASAAATTAEALRRVKGLRPDVILLDPLSGDLDARMLLTSLRDDPAVRRQPTVFLFLLRYDIAAAELRDPLAVVPFPTTDAMKLGFEATLSAALRDVPTGGRAPLVAALGGPDLGALLEPVRRQGAAPVLCASGEELEGRLGPQHPHLLILDLRRTDSPQQNPGERLRRLCGTGLEGRVPIVLVVDADDPLLSPDVRSLLPFGAPPIPVERIARAVRDSSQEIVESGVHRV
jgi:PAS domain S-box-containing protein